MLGHYSIHKYDDRIMIILAAKDQHPTVFYTDYNDLDSAIENLNNLGWIPLDNNLEYATLQPSDNGGHNETEGAETPESQCESINNSKV